MDIFFNSWESVIRVVITIFFAYPGIILLLRISGKRSLSKLNMFDFIITIALGSIFASVSISKDITIIDGIITFGLLLGFQFLISWSSLRWSVVERIIKSKPTLVYHDGQFLEKDMQYVRVTKQEIMASVRQNGIACMNDVHAVILENNGDLSVLSANDKITKSTLVGLSNYELNE